MPLAKIHLITSTSTGTLLVFYSEGNCWHSRVLSSSGVVFGRRKLYYTAEAAEKAGESGFALAGEWLVQPLPLDLMR